MGADSDARWERERGDRGAGGAWRAGIARRKAARAGADAESLCNAIRAAPPFGARAGRHADLIGGQAVTRRGQSAESSTSDLTFDDHAGCLRGATLDCAARVRLGLGSKTEGLLIVDDPTVLTGRAGVFFEWIAGLRIDHQRSRGAGRERERETPERV